MMTVSIVQTDTIILHIISNAYHAMRPVKHVIIHSILMIALNATMDIIKAIIGRAIIHTHAVNAQMDANVVILLLFAMNVLMATC